MRDSWLAPCLQPVLLVGHATLRFSLLEPVPIRALDVMQRHGDGLAGLALRNTIAVLEQLVQAADQNLFRGLSLVAHG